MRFGMGRRPAVQRWSFAACAFVLSLVCRIVLDADLPDGFPFVTFFPAVILTALFSGLWPAVAVAVGCGIAAWALFLPNPGAVPDGAGLLALAFYVAIVVVDIVVIHVMTLALGQLRVERERSQQLAEGRALLFRELQHRVSNNLQVVGALMALQKATVKDVAARRVIEEAASRLGLIGRLHRKLHDPHGQQVGWDAFLGELCADVIGSMDAQGKVSCAISADAVVLSPDQTVPLALIVAELISNALEHGFPAESRGAISVALRREGDGLVALTVADDGHGLSPGFDLDATRSLGLRIVKALAAQLGGSFDMRSQLPGAGTICHIRFAG